MKSSGRLTAYIIIAMIAGAILGYLVFTFGKGTNITYTSTKDFKGFDTLVLNISGEKTQQVVAVGLDADALSKIDTRDIWIADKNSTKKFVPSVLQKDPSKKLVAVELPPKQGTATISATQSFSDNIKLLTTIFLRLVQMIIAPLVFSTLVVGIAKLGDLKTVGRVGGKALLWFISASLASLLLGMMLVNFFKPGVGLDLSHADANSVKDLAGKTQTFTLQNFVEHVFPTSLIDAMATNQILQIVVFSVFFGVATAAMGDYAKPLIKALDVVSHIILKMVGYVMKFAPFGVFGAIAGVIAVNGLGIFVFYAKYYLFFVTGILLLWVVLVTVGFIILKKRMPSLLQHIVQPLIVAFTTTSSEAVFPKLTEELERFGCKDKIVAFVLPLGYSFNLDGSMMYMTFASIAIAQAYNIPLDFGTQLTMLLVLMLTSKGIAGVPRASLVVVLATCSMFKIPPEGVALILPIDHFCDMFRTATNVLGNALATSVVSKWEGELESTTEAA